MTRMSRVHTVQSPQSIYRVRVPLPHTDNSQSLECPYSRGPTTQRINIVRAHSQNSKSQSAHTFQGPAPRGFTQWEYPCSPGSQSAHTVYGPHKDELHSESAQPILSGAYTEYSQSVFLCSSVPTHRIHRLRVQSRAHTWNSQVERVVQGPHRGFTCPYGLLCKNVVRT